MRRFPAGPLVLWLSPILLPVVLLAQEAPSRPERTPLPGTNDSVTVICEPGIRLIVDGVYAGVTPSPTNSISLQPTTNAVHRLILQKPDPVARGGARSGYLPQSFTLTLAPAQSNEVVAAPFLPVAMGVAQMVPPGCQKPPDCGYGQLILSGNPEHCTVEFRSEILPLPANIMDVCEGTYGLLFHHNGETLRTNVTIRRHQPLVLQADFVQSRLRDLLEERAQYAQRIRNLITALRANGFADFAALPENEKDYVIGMLHGDVQTRLKEWGQPDQKPICRDVLLCQGYSFGNGVGWTMDAIDLVEKQGWHDLRPLIAHIYEHPKNTFNYERAFLYLRAQAGQPVPPNLAADSQTLCSSSEFRNTVSDAQLLGIQQRLLKEADQEAVLVYCLHPCIYGSKGSTDRGARVAIDILKQLDRAIVTRHLRQFLRAGDPDCRSALAWVAKQLGIDSGSIRAPDQPAAAPAP